MVNTFGYRHAIAVDNLNKKDKTKMYINKECQAVWF
jgi:hypothetical protein